MDNTYVKLTNLLQTEFLVKQIKQMAGSVFAEPYQFYSFIQLRRKGCLRGEMIKLCGPKQIKARLPLD